MDKKGTKNKNRDIETGKLPFFLILTECCLTGTVRATRDKQRKIFYIVITPLYAWFMPRPQLDNFFYNEAKGIKIKTYSCGTQRTPSLLSTCIHILNHPRCSHGKRGAACLAYICWSARKSAPKPNRQRSSIASLGFIPSHNETYYTGIELYAGRLGPKWCNCDYSTMP